MFAGTAIGRVTKDLEVQHSTSGIPYVRFCLAVNKGYGTHAHAVFPQCWIFGQDNVDRIVKAKVGKGSLLHISGDIDLVEYEQKQDGIAEKTTAMKIIVWNWGFIPSGRPKDLENADDPGGPKRELNLEDFEVIPDDDEPF